VKKIYYTIGEVSELLGEKQSTLRYWEKEFKLLTPGEAREVDDFIQNKIVIYLKKSSISFMRQNTLLREREGALMKNPLSQIY